MEKYGSTPSVSQNSFEDEDIEPDDTRKKQTYNGIAPKYSKEIEQAQIIITFNMENPDNRVEYDIWYTSTDD